MTPPASSAPVLIGRVKITFVDGTFQWADTFVWGSFIGTRVGDTVIWGNLTPSPNPSQTWNQVSGDNIVWGTFGKGAGPHGENASVLAEFLKG